MSKDLVVMDNAVINAAYDLSLNEQRLILSAIAQIPKEAFVDAKQAYYVTRDDFIRLGVHPDNVAREIRSASKDLMKRSLFINTEIGELEFHWLSEVLRYDKNAEEKIRAKYPNPEDYSKYIQLLKAYNIIDSLNPPVDDENVIVRLVFNERIVPFLSELRKNFTQFNIEDVAGFGSSYSMRLYQAMMQYKSTGYRKIKLKDLRYMLALGTKYKATKDLKVRVIDTAINEINEKSPYQVSYKMLKTGRKFTDLEIKFQPKKSALKEATIRNPTTFEHQPINSEKTPSWQRKGLSDAQIKKLAIYKDQFVEANTHLLRDKNISYYDAFESFKDQLQDPEHVGKFHMLAEFLALKKDDEPPKVAKKPAQSQKKVSKNTTKVINRQGLTAEQIEFFATHPQFQMDHPVKGYEVGSEAQISYLKLGLGSRPADFFETDFNKYLK
ncbi:MULTISPECIES: RepB family plasmid replication initiator protein [Psychrobacter]|uniref:RepB family plasmid replication initiator protein n=1 Tax=Psychrobacter TaxID=497 RepID=UPI001469CC2F|nr:MULTISPECIES: RepB family plasmid replication initiator protein [Psychrobacter]